MGFTPVYQSSCSSPQHWPWTCRALIFLNHHHSWQRDPRLLWSCNAISSTKMKEVIFKIKIQNVRNRRLWLVVYFYIETPKSNNNPIIRVVVWVYGPGYTSICKPSCKGFISMMSALECLLFKCVMFSLASLPFTTLLPLPRTHFLSFRGLFFLQDLIQGLCPQCKLAFLRAQILLKSFHCTFCSLPSGIFVRGRELTFTQNPRVALKDSKTIWRKKDE